MNFSAQPRRSRLSTRCSFSCAAKKTEPKEGRPVIVSIQSVSDLPAKLKKLASLRQFLILNAFSPEPSLKQSMGNKKQNVIEGVLTQGDFL